MKVGLNELCPCGSGKIFKDCCLRKLGDFYARLKAYNNVLRYKKFNVLYSDATFGQAVELTITCNALSLIKSYFQSNHYSITNALNLRNIIENLILLFMDRAGDISETRKKLFTEQYKLIEYDCYVKNKGGKYKSIVDLDALNAAYEAGKREFLAVVGSQSKLKKIITSRLPFLCDETINFNKLIEKYAPPEVLDAYISLSRRVHPTCYELFRDEYFQRYYDAVFSLIIHMLYDVYSSLPEVSSALTYGLEQAAACAVPLGGNRRLQSIVNEQCGILSGLSAAIKKVYEDGSYVEYFIDEALSVLRDVNTDYQSGYPENVQLKFKSAVEMFACFYKVYNAEMFSDGYYFCEMLRRHDIVKEREQRGLEIDGIGEIYKRYLKKYPSSTLTESAFFKKYDEMLGFLVNGEGETPTLGQLVDWYLDKIYKDKLMSNADIKAKDFYKMVYKESNNMSHGSGYMYFANIGAFGDAAAPIQFLDYAVTHFLRHLKVIFDHFAEYAESNKIIAGQLEKSLDKMRVLCKEKAEILKACPK